MEWLNKGGSKAFTCLVTHAVLVSVGGQGLGELRGSVSLVPMTKDPLQHGDT